MENGSARCVGDGGHGPRVIMLFQHPLFARGLQYLLMRHGASVVGMEKNLEDGVRLIRTAAPEFVLVEGDRAFRGLAPFLRAVFDSVTVLTLNLESTEVGIYDSTHIPKSVDVHDEFRLLRLLGLSPK